MARCTRPRIGSGNGRTGDGADAHHRVDQDPCYSRLIPLADEMPLAEVLSSHSFGFAGAVAGTHQQALELIRSRAEEKDGGPFSSKSRTPLEGFNNSFPTNLLPKATYSIGLSKSSFDQVAVGSNPWTKADPAKMVNLAAVCERYGGGAMRAWAPSASRLTRQCWRAKRRRRLWRNCGLRESAEVKLERADIQHCGGTTFVHLGCNVAQETLHARNAVSPRQDRCTCKGRSDGHLRRRWPYISDAFRMMLMRTVAERRHFPSTLWTPSAETVEAMKAARRASWSR